MNNERDYETYSSKRHSKIPNSLPAINSGGDEGEAQTLDIAWLVAVLRRRFLIMAATAIALISISGGLIIFVAKKTPPEYEGSFRVLVEPVTVEGRLARLSLLGQTVGATGATDVQKLQIEDSSLLDYETQIRVLTSPKLMEPVVKELQAEYPDINYSEILNHLILNRITYDKDGKQQGTKILSVSYLDKDPKKILFVLKKLQKVYLNYSLQERLTSLNKGIEFINQQLPELQGRVDMIQRKLQALRQEYGLTGNEETGKMLTEQSKTLELQRIDIEAKLLEARIAYQSLEKQLFQPDGSAVLGISAGKVLETIINERQKIEAQIANDSAQFLPNSPPMLDLYEKRENFRILWQKELKKLVENTASEISQLEARQAIIIRSEKEVNQKLKVFPLFLRQVSDLQRDLEVSTDSLKLFLAKREALKLDASQRDIPWELIAEPDIPKDKIGKLVPAAAKQTSRQLAIAIILNILLGIGVGFVREILHTVFHTPEDIKGVSRLPLLGVIPFAKELKKQPRKQKKFDVVGAIASLLQREEVTPVSVNINGNGNSNGNGNGNSNGNGNGNGKITVPQHYTNWGSPFLESFRSLYTNIRLLSSGRSIHSLALSSAVPGDGKSTIAVYLARTAAAIGQRVLIVDADLRRPQLHNRFNVPNIQGLSNAISSDLGLNETIQRVPDTDNLFVLTSGPIPDDPIKLLSSEKMQYLMEQFQAFFDVVIYDTPPLIGLADASIIAANTDGMVMVVGLQKTDRGMVTKALDSLKISGASVLGLVANGIKGYQPATYATYEKYYQKAKHYVDTTN